MTSESKNTVDPLATANWSSNSIFNASRAYDTSLVNAENTYTNASFNAQKAATLSYYDAAISELTQTIDLESKQKADEAEHCNLLATTQAEVIDDLFEDLEEIAPDDGDGITNWLGSLQTSGSTIGTVATTEQSARSGRNSANTMSLSNLKTTLAATRAKQEAAADRLYRNSEQGAWNTYLTGVQSANTAYLTSQKTAENTHKTASDDAEQAFDTSAITAYSAFNAEACRLTGLYYDALNLAQNGSGITSTFFSDGSSSIDFEVCFVAGTPILLADGTSKSIEEIQSGDMVLAVDHEHPNSTPKPSRVTRVFHNAPQATWKLTLADGQTIQCTKEHPFYIIGRGWTSAEDLGIGDYLIRPDGSRISLSTKEYVETVQPVFNFEVENAHTYFVGKTIETAVLVHNVCPICGGSESIVMKVSDESRTTIIATNCYCHGDVGENLDKRICERVNINIEKLKSCGISEIAVNKLSSTLTEYLESYYHLNGIEARYLRQKLSNDDEHWSQRFINNHNDEFLKLDWEILSQPQLKKYVEQGKTVTCNFLGETWTLLRNNESIYHGPQKNGTDCYKWCSPSGRELVIRKDHTLEMDPTYFGTYNYVNPDGFGYVGHFFQDVVPYYIYDNTPDIDEIITRVLKQDAEYQSMKNYFWSEFSWQ